MWQNHLEWRYLRIWHSSTSNYRSTFTNCSHIYFSCFFHIFILNPLQTASEKGIEWARNVLDTLQILYSLNQHVHSLAEGFPWSRQCQSASQEKRNQELFTCCVAIFFFLFSCQDKRTVSTETEWISKDNTEYEPKCEPKPQGSTRETTKYRHYSVGTVSTDLFKGSSCPTRCCRPVSVSTKATCAFVCWCLRQKGVEMVRRKHC